MYHPYMTANPLLPMVCSLIMYLHVGFGAVLPFFLYISFFIFNFHYYKKNIHTIHGTIITPCRCKAHDHVCLRKKDTVKIHLAT